MLKKVKYSLLAGLSFMLLASPLAARDSDNEQPIAIEADNLELRELEKISIYTGNVRLKQGSLEISSERLVIHFNDAGDLVLMEMAGTPARLRRLDNDNREMRGQALKINYRESESLLELVDQARFSHAGDTIESSLILINTDDNNIQAGSSDSDERVKMLIKPRNDANSAE